MASASNSDGSLLWRQVIPLAAPVALPVRDGGTMDKDEKPAVKVLELVLHPQKRLVMALTRLVPAKQNATCLFIGGVNS